MFAKVGIIQQSAKHNLKKNFEARQYRLEIHVGIGISATKRKNEGVSLALRKQDSNPKNIYPLRLYDQRNRPLTTKEKRCYPLRNSTYTFHFYTK